MDSKVAENENESSCSPCSLFVEEVRQIEKIVNTLEEEKKPLKNDSGGGSEFSEKYSVLPPFYKEKDRKFPGFPGKRSENLSQKIKKCQESTIYKIGVLIIIFGLSCTILYLLALNSIYKSLNRNIPSVAVCTSQHSSEWEIKGKNLTDELLKRVYSDKWIFFKENSYGFKFYTRDDGDIFKVNGTYNYPPRKILEIYFDDYENYPAWDRYVKNATILKKFGDQTVLTYHKEAFMGIARDFVTIGHWEPYKKGFIFGLKSVLWEDEELLGLKDPNIVRGYFGVSGPLLEPLNEGNSTAFQIVIEADTKMDWLPFRDTLMISYADKKVTAMKNRIKNLS